MKLQTAGDIFPCFYPIDIVVLHPPFRELASLQHMQKSHTTQYSHHEMWKKEVFFDPSGLTGSPEVPFMC